jgi:hypothetical protein
MKLIDTREICRRGEFEGAHIPLSAHQAHACGI